MFTRQPACSKCARHTSVRFLCYLVVDLRVWRVPFRVCSPCRRTRRRHRRGLQGRRGERGQRQRVRTAEVQAQPDHVQPGPAGRTRAGIRQEPLPVREHARTAGRQDQSVRGESPSKWIVRRVHGGTSPKNSTNRRRFIARVYRSQSSVQIDGREKRRATVNRNRQTPPLRKLAIACNGCTNTWNGVKPFKLVRRSWTDISNTSC